MVELHFGDCLDVLPTLSRQVDMVLADLPYGTTACKWDTVIPLDVLWGHYKRLVKPGGVVALFGSEPFSSTVRMSNLEWFRYDWIWDKVRPSGFQIAKYAPMKRHEIISIFSSKTPNYYPQMVKLDKPYTYRCGPPSESNPIKYNDGKQRTATHKHPQTILTFYKQADGKYLHPTQKPVGLLEYLIRTYTQDGDTVLDNVMGSGSTGVACKNTGRSFIGIEQEEKYFNIAKERIGE